MADAEHVGETVTTSNTKPKEKGAARAMIASKRDIIPKPAAQDYDIIMGDAVDNGASTRTRKRPLSKSKQVY